MRPEFYNSPLRPPRCTAPPHPIVNFLLENYNWAIALVALVSGGMLAWPALSRSARGASITPTQAVLLINREKAVVIDVCEPEEYAAGHVVGARNVPVGSIDSTKDLPSNKTLPLVLVCATGARAARAAGALKGLGYQNVNVLGGGIAAWREANLPVEKSASADKSDKPGKGGEKGGTKAGQAA